MILELLGWFGTVVYLLNHAYISLKQNWQKSIYYGGNLLAALALVVSSFFASSNQAVIINAFWAIVSLAILLNWPIKKVPINKQTFYTGLAGILGVFVYQSVANSAINITWLGWSSAFVFTLGYLLFCSNRINQTTYLGLNAYAALVLLPQLWVDQNMPVFVLEIAWAGISIFGVYKRVSEPHLID